METQSETKSDGNTIIYTINGGDNHFTINNSSNDNAVKLLEEESKLKSYIAKENMSIIRSLVDEIKKPEMMEAFRIAIIGVDKKKKIRSDKRKKKFSER